MERHHSVADEFDNLERADLIAGQKRMSTTMEFDVHSSLQQLSEALDAGLISASAAENIKAWLTEPRYAEYAATVAEHIQNQQWRVLDDVFWTVIPFGTGGRRGRMYSIGTNAINQRTIGESAQGLAEYVREFKPGGPWKAAIAYDTRHRSREFAELCAEVLVANGFHVYFLDDYRSTPELSFLVRYRECDCGIMVTASHNPPSDNAVKVYWSSGVQLVPPHDREVIARVERVEAIQRVDFRQAVAAGQIELCREEVDRAFLRVHLQQSLGGPRDVRVIYSPLHGVGEFNVSSLLRAAGFTDLEIYERHREPSGDFPNVPGNVSNPENAAVFEEIIRRGQEVGADLILATDPDCDRLGAAAPVTLDSRGSWRTLNGNQLGVLLGEFVMRRRSELGTLPKDGYVVTTLVTSQMLSRVCDRFGVRCLSDNLVGFKWICTVIDEQGPDGFVFGTEESHGYLVGTYARDKDGAVAALLMSELAAWVKSQGRSMFEHLDGLYRQFGLHAERLLTIQMEGSDGMQRMRRLMDRFRTEPPTQLGNLKVAALRDYLEGQSRLMGETSTPMSGPKDNLIFLETERPGNYIAVRPSGTEPKVKFYMFGYLAAEAIADLESDKAVLERQLADFESSLREYAASV